MVAADVGQEGAGQLEGCHDMVERRQVRIHVYLSISRLSLSVAARIPVVFVCVCECARGLESERGTMTLQARKYDLTCVAT